MARDNPTVKVPAGLRAAGVTAREAEVLEAVGARLTNVEIADRLYISVRTVESHVSALLRKLGESDRGALAKRAREALGPGEAPLPLPGGLAAAVAAGPFVGRDDALARLEQLAEVSRSSGVRRLALITGEAGIGKTRLAAEAAARLHRRGAIVCFGRCEDDALVPFQAFSEAIVPLLLGDTDDPFVRLAEAGSDAATARHRLFEEFDRLLASRPTLVVLVVDDVQWVDPSGLQLLRHVLRHVDRSSLVVLAPARPEAVDPHHPLAAVLAAVQTAHILDVITLEGLSLADAKAIAASLATGDEDDARVAWERTGGNPFLLSELLLHSPTGGGLPPTARDAIVRRIAGLGPAVFDVLAAAAVIGETFRLEIVAAALGLDLAAQEHALQRAFGAGLVRADDRRRGEYRFAHAIVREALSAVTSPSHRARLHLRVAEALEGTGSKAATPDIARHRHAALPAGDPAAAHRAALAAAAQSMDTLAYEVAATFADMALDAIEAGTCDDYDRAGALLVRGRAHLKAGDLERGVADCRLALEVAERHGDARLSADAVLGWAEAAALWGRAPELRAALETVLASGVDDVALRAQLRAKLAQVLYYENARERRVELSRQAVDDARRSGRAATLASVLATTHAALWGPEDLDERSAVAREIVAIAAASGNPELELTGLGSLAVDLLEVGDRRGAEVAMGRYTVLAERLRHRLGLRDVEMWTAMWALLDGRFDDATEHLERARDLGEAAHDPGTAWIYWTQRIYVAIERGDEQEMDDLVEPSLRCVAENKDVLAWPAGLALIHARRGDREAAAALFEPLAADDFAAISRDVVYLNTMTFLAETCALLGDAPRAATLRRMLEPYAERVAVIDRALACKGSVHRFLALLAATTGDVDEARRHLRLALEQHQAMGAVVLAERTRRELASLESVASTRALATVLITDIVDSTKRAAAIGDEQWRQLLDRHDEITRRAITRFRGRLVKHTGDGVLATFDAVGRAVSCAAAIRDELKTAGLVVRAGLHAGEIESRGDDVAGIGVHIAQRVCALAGGGEILVSATIAALAAGSGLEFHDRGDFELKGVPGRVRLHSLA